MTTILPLLAALAILPSQTRNQTRGVILLREGPARPLAVVPGKADPKLFDGRTRIAVAPIIVKSDDKTLAGQNLGLMDAIAADLRYIPSYLVADRSEVLAATDAGGGGPTPASLREKLEAKLVVTGTLTEKGADLELELHLNRVEQGKSTRIGSGKAVATKDQIFALGDRALLTLLDAVGVTPPADNVREIEKIPTRSFVARTEVDAGLARLDGLMGPGQTPEAIKLASEAACRHAEAAIKDAPNYNAALMLKASCLYNLDRLDLERCLEEAIKRYDLAPLDFISGYELIGDYEVFHEKRMKLAVHQYEVILLYDPGNVRALWSLITLYAGDHGETDLDPSLEKAGDYAARLIQAHPTSPAARALSSPKPSNPGPR